MARSAGLLAAVALSAIVYAACTSEGSAPTMASEPTVADVGTEKCSDFGSFTSKDEVGPPWSITASAGQVVTEVCVKAGTQVYITSSNGIIYVGSTPCFRVTGLGTATVRVRNAAGHVGNICKGISHIEVNFGPGPTPTPTPTPTSSPA